MLLSNDATALILTPIVYSLVTRLRLPVLPYLFACTFIADTASFLLPVSNPINILATSQFPLGLLTFLRLLFLPSLLVIGINAGVFYFLYRNLSASVKQEISKELRDRLPTPEWRNSFGKQLLRGKHRSSCCVITIARSNRLKHVHFSST
jgi:Na+/H+ antiporter NhaD/arsenite permease-like protein